MAWPKAGTVAVTNGSNIVAGTGTSFFAAAQAGWGFVGPDGRVYEVASVQSGTELSLATPYQGATAGGQFYSLFPTMSLAHGLVASVQALIANFQGVVDGPGAGKFSGDVVQQGDEDTGVSWPEGNAIALKAADVLQLILKDGAASGAAVQGSAIDVATPGRLVTVAGARAAASSNYGAYYNAASNLNIDTVNAGFVGLVNDANPGTWPLEPFGGFVWINAQSIYAGEAVLQRAVYGYDSTGPSKPKVYLRIRANIGGAWSDWVRIMTDADGVLTKGSGGLLAKGQIITDFSTVPGESQFIAGGGANVVADEPPNGGGYKPGILCCRGGSARSSVLMFTINGIAVRNYSDGVPDGDWIELSPPERGSNANGEYERFSDGTLICWGSKTIVPVANTPTLVPITFPHAFNDVQYSPQVTPWSGTIGNAVKGASFTNPTASGMDLVVHRTDTNSTILRWHCIGRWK